MNAYYALSFLLLSFVSLKSVLTELENKSSQHQLQLFGYQYALNQSNLDISYKKTYLNTTYRYNKFLNATNSTAPEGNKINNHPLPRPSDDKSGSHNLGHHRQARSQVILHTSANRRTDSHFPPELVYTDGQLYDPLPHVSNNGEIYSTLESPIWHAHQNGYGDGNYGYYEYSTPTEAPETTEESEEDEEDDETEETTTEEITTTTLAPFTLADVKVPAPFLRIEYMISFTFFGALYGLGFLVLFQSLCVPAAKIAVYIVYIMLLKFGAIEPVTLEQALQQLPPT